MTCGFIRKIVGGRVQNSEKVRPKMTPTQPKPLRDKRSSDWLGQYRHAHGVFQRHDSTTRALGTRFTERFRCETHELVKEKCGRKGRGGFSRGDVHRTIGGASVGE
jgi:hypothetical protein